MPHFRRAALERAGRWDPFNVTEDADLGLRLWRSGYRTAMITRPTLEDAPHKLKAWLPQRTRWFKGWMQTWIVHTREPRRLMRNMSPRAFAITQILLTGTFVSALLHPLVLLNAILLSVWLLVDAPLRVHMSWIAWMDWTMILASYAAFTALCWQATEPAYAAADRLARLSRPDLLARPVLCRLAGADPSVSRARSSGRRRRTRRTRPGADWPPRPLSIAVPVHI